MLGHLFRFYCTKQQDGKLSVICFHFLVIIDLSQAPLPREDSMLSSEVEPDEHEWTTLVLIVMDRSGITLLQPRKIAIEDPEGFNAGLRHWGLGFKCLGVILRYTTGWCRSEKRGGWSQKGSRVRLS